MSAPSQPSQPALPDLTELIRALTALAEPRPVPLEVWRDVVVALYSDRPGTTTRLKMGQVLRETLSLAGDGATTAALGPELVARVASRPGAASTTNGLLASLRVACRIAAERGWVNPATVRACRWRVLDPGPTRRIWHSRAEVARVLAHLMDRSDTWVGGRLHALACLLAYAGLRRNEALRLRVEDLDLAAGIALVRPHEARLKTPGSCAPVPLPAALVATLTAWLPRCGGTWVIPGLRRQGPWTGGTSGQRAGDRLKAAGLVCGVDGFTPHSLRHSLATHLAGHWGLSPSQIRMILRHSSERTQALYVHRDMSDLQSRVAGFRYDDGPARAAPRLRLILV